ncbi:MULTISPECIES: gamma-glutamyl-gamma-aminobutyrate hydrolase family protein [unclassified Butyrivibrio]|uniref:gamma-glutamyl-gamma-aminobutyrate hydrolase family protein n=1 Tax=unclassified Butyrivibrio TaxID=2639466 RepID=UPI00042101E1|nr:MULTISPECIES: gamma-glutamyl-gamma-aminobutyrate hydrolase family protein [unclassified Butyrivibrio]
MKKVIFTQRVEIIESYNERRDCADQNIANFILKCGYCPIPIPNLPELVEDYLHEVKPIGIILSGGSNLAKYGGDTIERDETEKRLVDFALNNSIPVYGFCRGMQFILDYYKCSLNKISGHVAVKHNVSGEIGNRIVNSYHNYACTDIDECMRNGVNVVAVSDDKIVEAIKVKDANIVGTMWHPERNIPFEESDIEMLRCLFK